MMYNAPLCYTILTLAWHHDSGAPHWTQLGLSRPDQPPEPEPESISQSPQLRLQDIQIRSLTHHLPLSQLRKKIFITMLKDVLHVILEVSPCYQTESVPPWRGLWVTAGPGLVMAAVWQCGQCLPVCQRQRRALPGNQSEASTVSLTVQCFMWHA